MKRVLLSTACGLLLCFTVSAQAVLDSTLTRFDVFAYNTNGDKDKQFVHLTAEGNYVSTYFYTPENKLLRIEHIALNGDTLAVETFTYEDNKVEHLARYTEEILPTTKSTYFGVDELETNATLDAVVGAMGMGAVYFCDSMKIERHTTGDQWETIIEIIFTAGNDIQHPKGGKLLLGIIEGLPEFTHGLEIDFTMTYDDNNNCTKIFASYQLFILPIEVLTVENEYSTKNLITESHQKFNELLPFKETKTSYTYHSNDLLQTKAHSTYDSVSQSFVVSEKQYNVYKGTDLDTAYFYSFHEKSKIGNDVFLPLAVYPNPASDFITITGIEEEATVYVFDMSGKQLLQSEISIENTKLDIQPFASGTYLIKIQNKKGVFFSKIIKNK